MRSIILKIIGRGGGGRLVGAKCRQKWSRSLVRSLFGKPFLVNHCLLHYGLSMKGDSFFRSLASIRIDWLFLD